MKNLRFICAQPASIYYSWQVEVMLNNFESMGIDLKNVDIVCWKINGVIPDGWLNLADHYAARFYFYDDTRVTKYYISSIRPNILKQHFEANPELEQEAIFYHDCDIVFTKPINWEQFLEDDKWYGSDCRWYIAHDYIIGKGEDVLDKMCEIVSIPKHVIQKNELNSIGAQYLMKDINWRFWAEVEVDCERLFAEQYPLIKSCFPSTIAIEICSTIFDRCALNKLSPPNCISLECCTFFNTLCAN